MPMARQLGVCLKTLYPEFSIIPKFRHTLLYTISKLVEFRILTGLSFKKELMVQLKLNPTIHIFIYKKLSST
jgi:hypothetical protein